MNLNINIQSCSIICLNKDFFFLLICSSDSKLQRSHVCGNTKMVDVISNTKFYLNCSDMGVFEIQSPVAGGCFG